MLPSLDCSIPPIPPYFWIAGGGSEDSRTDLTKHPFILNPQKYIDLQSPFLTSGGILKGLLELQPS